MILKDDKKLSPGNYPGLADFHSPFSLRAMDIKFADIDFSLLAKAQFFLSLKRRSPNGHLTTPWNTSKPLDLEASWPHQKILFNSSNSCSRLAACRGEDISLKGNKFTILTKKFFLFKNQNMDRMLPPVTFPSMALRLQLFAQPSPCLLT